ncbi:hypothetical protein EC839_10688 [Pseudomonas sp. JUb52]|nr:hypothetical protein EC839_10688 [Pseudomonas sp. JUb52]
MHPPFSPSLKRHWQRLRPGTSCALGAAWLPAGLPLCEGCDSELPWLGPPCQCCALPLPVDGMLCGACLAKPPAFDQVLAPWRYAFPVDTLINRFKHHDRGSLGRLAGALLARHLQHLFDEGQPRPDWLLPVPISPLRLRQRGFNQAALLAGWLARQGPATAGGCRVTATGAGTAQPAGPERQRAAAQSQAGLRPGKGRPAGGSPPGAGGRCPHHRRHRRQPGAAAQARRRPASRRLLPGADATAW